MSTIKDFIKYLIENQWLYIAYAVPVILLLLVVAGWCYINRNRIFYKVTGFLNWLRPSFETGGYASPEKISAAVLLSCGYIPCLIIVMLSSDATHKNYALGITAVFILTLFRIITPQQLAELKDGISPSKPNIPTDEK